MYIDYKNDSILQTGLSHEEAEVEHAAVPDFSTSLPLFRTNSLGSESSLHERLSVDDEEAETKSLPASIAQRSAISFMNRRDFDSIPSVTGNLRTLRQGFGSIEFVRDKQEDGDDELDQRSIE
jgi:hypothetical protein